MSNNEAKFLLEAYRANGADATDPAFAPALEQAKADPAVAAWFAREQAHSAAISAKLREIVPPPGLREAILAGGRATTRAVPSSRATRFSFGQWLGMAAAVAALVTTATLFWPKPALNAQTLTAFAMDDVLHGKHGGHGVPEKSLQAELSQTSAHLSSGLPVDFRTLAGTGCRTLEIAGRDVLEVCFVRNGAEFHCYIGRATDFDGGIAAHAGPQFVQENALAAASWTAGAYRYVVVGTAGLDAVKRLL